MKRTYHPIMLTLIVMGAIGFFTTPASAISFTLSNDTTIVDVTPLSGSLSASDFYDYVRIPESRIWSGFPAFGAEAHTGFFWLYENTNSGALSLGMIFNEHGAGGKGEVDLSISGLPSGAFWEVQDDPGDIRRSWTETDQSWIGDFIWQDSSDGAFIGGLTGSDEITIELASSLSMENWYFLSGDSVNPDRIALILGNPSLTIAPSAATPTPEPGTLLLLGSGLIGLGAIRRRRQG